MSGGSSVGSGGGGVVSVLRAWLGVEEVVTASPASFPPSVNNLVDEATRFDVTRHRHELDDGHLSSTAIKRQLRGIILNETRVAAEMASWRAATGYDRSYKAHCRRYGLRYYEQAIEDGYARGASYGRRLERESQRPRKISRRA